MACGGGGQRLACAAMSTAFFTHPACLDHATPEGHPERAARLQAVLRALEAPEFAALSRHQAPLAPESELLRCHPQRYVDAIREAIPEDGSLALDADTHVSPSSLSAARAGLGQVLGALDAVMAGKAANAFVATRPPGHHAETARPMGFCLFGNVAIAAKRALDHHGLSRVAVVDFDVHHGNGTQDLLWDEARVLFASSQQMPLWPGSGAASERGAHDQLINMPLPPGADGARFRAAWEEQALPRLADFAPELVLVSAGFDAHLRDPLAQLALDEDDFAWITHRLCDLADAHAGGRLVSVMEGGYDLDALASSVAVHVRVLMERGRDV